MTLHFNTTQDIGHGVAIMLICFTLVFLSVLIDLYTGLTAAKKCKERIQSHILRRTINKILCYLAVVFLGIFIDVLGLCFPWYAIPYFCIFTTLSCICIEGKSVIENLTKIKSPAAEVPDTIMSLAEKIRKYDLKSLKEVVEIAEKLNSKNQKI
jgi:phage-related holin